MSGSGDDNLPVILVSAVNAAVAAEIISELVKDDSSAVQCNGVSSAEDSPSSPGVVWQISNKYYAAAARLLPLADGAAPEPAQDVQAHLIYLTEDECEDTAACSRRAAAAGAGAAARGGVRLLAAPRESAALAAWAAGRRYELVALRRARDDEDEDDAPGGVARLREALHAHAWPGLRMRGAAAIAAPPDDSDGSSSESSWGSWAGAEPDAAEASLFLDALALLPARAQLRQQDDAARRLHAEQLVAAFCRALGGGGGGPEPERGE